MWTLRYYTNIRFVVPIVALITFLTGFLIFYAFLLSFYSGISPAGIPTDFVGLENYIRVFSSSRYWGAIGRTFYFTIVAIITKTLLGLMCALLLNRQFFGRGVIRGLTIIPWAIPLFVIGLMWYGIFSWTGPANHLLETFHLPTVNWLGSSWAMTSIILVNVWKGFPFYFLGFLAGLQNISQQLYEAAKIDGASPWQLFRYVTLPQLKPVMLTVILLSTIWTFGSFVTIYLMTAGGPGRTTELLSILVFSKAFAEFQPNLAAAMCVVILPFYLLLIFIVSSLLTE